MMVTRLPFHRDRTPSERTTRRSASNMPGWAARAAAAALERAGVDAAAEDDGAGAEPPGAAAALAAANGKLTGPALGAVALDAAALPDAAGASNAWTWYRITSRASGAVQVFAIAPATPPESACRMFADRASGFGAAMLLAAPVVPLPSAALLLLLPLRVVLCIALLLLVSPPR